MEREVSGDTDSNLVYSYADVIGVALSIYDYHTSAILPLIRGPLFLVFIVFFFFFLTPPPFNFSFLCFLFFSFCENLFWELV